MDGVWWLDMKNFFEEEVCVVCRVFGIYFLIIEDIMMQEFCEKIEFFLLYYFVCFWLFFIENDEDGEKEFKFFNIYVVVFCEGMLSFSYVKNFYVFYVWKRIVMFKDYVLFSSDWICYVLM